MTSQSVLLCSPDQCNSYSDHEPGLATAIRAQHRAVIVTHDGGHASEQDLNVWNRDLGSHGLHITTFRNDSDDHMT